MRVNDKHEYYVPPDGAGYVHLDDCKECLIERAEQAEQRLTVVEEALEECLAGMKQDGTRGWNSLIGLAQAALRWCEVTDADLEVRAREIVDEWFASEKRSALVLMKMIRNAMRRLLEAQATMSDGKG